MPAKKFNVAVFCYADRFPHKELPTEIATRLDDVDTPKICRLELCDYNVFRFDGLWQNPQGDRIYHDLNSINGIYDAVNNVQFDAVLIKGFQREFFKRASPCLAIDERESFSYGNDGNHRPWENCYEKWGVKQYDDHRDFSFLEMQEMGIISNALETMLSFMLERQVPHVGLLVPGYNWNQERRVPLQFANGFTFKSSKLHVIDANDLPQKFKIKTTCLSNYEQGKTYEDYRSTSLAPFVERWPDPGYVDNNIFEDPIALRLEELTKDHSLMEKMQVRTSFGRILYKGIYRADEISPDIPTKYLRKIAVVTDKRISADGYPGNIGIVIEPKAYQTTCGIGIYGCLSGGNFLQRTPVHATNWKAALDVCLQSDSK